MFSIDDDGSLPLEILVDTVTDRAQDTGQQVPAARFIPPKVQACNHGDT